MSDSFTKPAFMFGLLTISGLTIAIRSLFSHPKSGSSPRYGRLQHLQ